MKHVTIAFTALALIAGSAQAQKSRSQTLIPETRGFMLAGHTLFATGVTIAGPGVRQEIKTASGEGVGLQFGYGFTRQIMAFASADVSKQKSEYEGFAGTMGLARLELGARMAFPKDGSRSVPYVSAHVGTHALGAHSDGGGVSVTLRLTGTQIGGGAGLLYAVSPSIALDAGVVGDYGKFSKFELSGDVNRNSVFQANNSSTIRLKVGFNWHP